MELTGDESGLPEVTRRTWLAAVGTSVAIAAGATGTGSADEHGYGASGYGAGPYGGQNTTDEEVVLGVSTIGATDIGTTSATLVGDLTDLQGVEQATVFFEYGPSNEDLPASTAGQTVGSTGEFETTVTGLASDTEYEVRAVAQADGEDVTGGTATFPTEQAADTSNPVPTIGQLTGADVSNDRNPHVDAEVSWAASIEDGEIYAAEMTLTGPDGLIETWEYDLNGQSVDRTETDRIPLGAREAGTEYTLDLIVYSYSGEYETATTTFESQ